MLVNKRVTSGNINLLRFLFPDYDLINENTIPDNPTRPAIYCGSADKLDYFIKIYKESNKDFIINSYMSDINLDDRRILCNIIFEKWRNGTLPKYLDKIIDDIPYNQFIEMVKVKWVSGKWTILKISDENTFLNLVEELNKSKLDFIKTYFLCLEDNKPHILESSFLSFLIKAKTKSYKGNSFLYKKKLELYKGKKLENTLKAIEEAQDYNIDNPELKLLNLLINIQDSNRKK